LQKVELLGECVPPGTQVLTKNKSWINIEEVHPGEEIFSLNPETYEIEIEEVEKTIRKPYKDKLVHIKNKSLDMMVTKNHVVLLWDRNDKPYEMKAIDLYTALKENNSKVHHSHIRRGGIWEGYDSEWIKGNIKAEDWAAFMGIYLAEGHCAGTKGGEKRTLVGITQNPGERQDKIKELLDKLPFDFKLQKNNRQFTSTNAWLYNELFALGSSKEKYIPQYAKEWSPCLLNIVLDWMLMGDGKNRKNRKGEILRELATISPRLADDTQEIMLKLGSGGSISFRQPEDRLIEGRLIKKENQNILHIIHEHTTKGSWLSKDTEANLVDYDGEVFCVTAPKNKTWLMRYNNSVCWTHNCDHPDDAIVSLSNVSHIVRESWWNGDEVMGKVEILNTPKGKIIQELLSSGVKVGISSRGVGETQKNNEGFDVVDESFVLVAFDIVSEPSTHGAYLHEGKNISLEDFKKSISKNDRINRAVNDILGKK